jgi:anti-sigma regulatory factor (Ser/Thr protein kinase)
MSPLRVEATLDALVEIGRYVEAAAAAGGLSKRQAYDLRLAVDEIATNIIVHGYQANGRSGDIVVRADSDDTAVTVTIEDWAPPFDPLSREMPSEADLSKPLEERDVGGLGIYLAVRSVDEFLHERRDDRNLNTFVVKRSPPS